MEDSAKRLYVKNYDEWKPYCERKCFSDRPLDVKTVEGGIVLPTLLVPAGSRPGQTADKYLGGVCDGNFRFVAGLLRDAPEHPGTMSVTESYHVDEGELEHMDETVIFGGVILGHFGHFMLEGMSRFWYFLQRKDLRLKIAFTTAIWNRRAWFDDFFEALGIDGDRLIYVERPTRFASVIVPDESVHSWGGFFTKEYLIPYEAIKQNVCSRGGSGSSKVYLSRRSYDNGLVSCCNEEYFEEFFKSKGYFVFEPEKYTFAEQINVVARADEIACTMGTLAHFALFAKRGVKLTLLVRTHDSVIVPQCLVNEAAGADWRMVDVSMNFLYGQRDLGVLLMGATTYWKKFVADMFGDVCGDDTLADGRVVRNYISRWCEWAAKEKNLDILDEKDFVSLLARFYEEFTGKDFPSGLPSRSPSRACAEEEIASLMWDASEAENHIKALESLTKGRPLIAYDAHIMGKGWLPVCYEGQEAGKDGEAIDAIRVRLIPAADEPIFCYEVYAPDVGWMPERRDGEAAGAGKKGRPIFGITIQIEGALSEKYDVSYRIFNAVNGWSPEVRGGKGISSDDAPVTALSMRLIEVGRDDVLE